MIKQAKFFLIAFLLVILLSNISFSIPTIVVEETELVKVEVDTFDPDEDEVTVVYSAPLDKNGEWLTSYGDAGNYTTIVTATDGKSLTEEEFRIIVKRKNRAPEIEVEDHISGYETEEIELDFKVTDPNGDKVEIEISEPFNKKGEWLTDYEDAGEYTISIKASDGELESIRMVRVTVEDTNRAPEFMVNQEDDSVEVDENEGLYFEVNATDPDGEDIVYLWELDEEIMAWENNYYYVPDFESAGIHFLKLIVSDGLDEIVKEWEIKVNDINRPPALPEFDDVTANEGQVLVLSLVAIDEDGDELIYTIDGPIGDNGVWEIGFEEAGEYEIEISVTDGQDIDSDIIYVFVNDVDRAPEFEEIEVLEVNESEELMIDLDANDPDGDEVYYLAYGFPEGAELEGDELVWQPDYDFIIKPNSFMVRLLSRIKLDKYLWEKRTLPVTFMACGKELCTNQTVEITVNNINRRPELWVADEVTINETDKIRIKPSATDPDNDVISFYFTEPLNKNGEWQPDYDEEGEYWAIVGVTDGKTSVEKTVHLIVNNLNRQPELAPIKGRQANEGEEIWINAQVQDPDKDELTIWLESAPEGSEFRDEWFIWTPGHNTITEKKGWVHDLISNSAWLNRKFSQEKQYFGVNFVVSDGDFIVSRLIDIAVRNWNQPPEIVNVTEVTEAYVGEPIIFAVDAVDLDGDELDYEWSFGFMNGGVKNAKVISRRFSSPGEKTITLTISDGRDSIEKEWNVLVGQRVVEEIVVATQPAVQPTFSTYVV